MMHSPLTHRPQINERRTLDRTEKHLAFNLGPEEFCIDVMKVREIISIQNITSVPHMPPYVKGVINLRGKVIPVVDLRLRLNLEESARTSASCIIVVDVESSLTGLIVDGVLEVTSAITSEIELPPDFGPGAGAHHIRGLAKVQGRVKILLDVDSILGSAGNLAAGEIVSAG